MHTGRRAAPLPVAFFERDVVEVARDLLGRRLVVDYRRARTVSRIVEVEAYLGALDPASHAYRLRKNAQNASLYLPPGTWYVYLSYGIHWCANLVAGTPGHGGAVLLRAVEPLEGEAVMRRRRGVPARELWCSGPGKLCQALGITRAALDGVPMPVSSAVILDEPIPEPRRIVATPRIGITKAAELPLRFHLEDNPWLSGLRARSKKKGRR